MNRRLVLAQILLGLGFTKLNWGQTSELKVHRAANPEAPITLISLIRLIANPDLFNGKRVRLHGYLDYGVGTDRALALYLSECDGRNAVSINAVYIKVEPDHLRSLIGKYVLLNCTYHSAGNAVDFGSNGYIDRVTDPIMSDFGDRVKQ
jgi:hypothetical protein